MSWLAEHLETFAKPILGYVPTQLTDTTRFFSPQEMSVIKNMWRSVKCEARRSGKQMLLAGRDVFVFEVLARREGYPTTFRPDISRLTVAHVKEDYSDYFLFDTGFMGSIAKGLRIKQYTMASSNKTAMVALGPLMHVYNRLHKTHKLLTGDTQQVFPRLKGARSLALKIERTPKYWRTAFYREGCQCHWRKVPFFATPETIAQETRKDIHGKHICRICDKRLHEENIGIGQEFSDKFEFLQAVKLTIEVYKDSSPRFTDGQLPTYLGT